MNTADHPPLSSTDHFSTGLVIPNPAKRDVAIQPDGLLQRPDCGPPRNDSPWNDPEAETVIATWRLEITAAPEPLLLARVLQKLAVPEIELLAVDYAAGTAAGEACTTLHIRAAAARARLATVRIEKLVSVRATLLSAVL